MFDKTFSFWRRVVGGAEQPKSTTNEDRRVWARFGTVLDVHVQATDKPNAPKRPAVIRDLSLGGASFTFDSTIQPGDMVRVEIHGGDGIIRTILACIVRSMPSSDGKWSIGCVFSRELTDEDLNMFGAQRVQAKPEDKRAWVRFDCNRTVAFQRINDRVKNTRSAQLLNISASGVGLSTDTDPIEAGSLISVELQTKSGVGPRNILACVVHTAQHANGAYAMGCNFIHVLSEAELQSLL